MFGKSGNRSLAIFISIAAKQGLRGQIVLYRYNILCNAVVRLLINELIKVRPYSFSLTFTVLYSIFGSNTTNNKTKQTNKISYFNSDLKMSIVF